MEMYVHRVDAQLMNGYTVLARGATGLNSYNLLFLHYILVKKAGVFFRKTSI